MCVAKLQCISHCIMYTSFSFTALYSCETKKKKEKKKMQISYRLSQSSCRGPNYYHVIFFFTHLERNCKIVIIFLFEPRAEVDRFSVACQSVFNISLVFLFKLVSRAKASTHHHLFVFNIELYIIKNKYNCPFMLASSLLQRNDFL